MATSHHKKVTTPAPPLPVTGGDRPPQPLGTTQATPGVHTWKVYGNSTFWTQKTRQRADGSKAKHCWTGMCKPSASDSNTGITFCDSLMLLCNNIHVAIGRDCGNDKLSVSHLGSGAVLAVSGSSGCSEEAFRPLAKRKSVCSSQCAVSFAQGRRSSLGAKAFSCCCAESISAEQSRRLNVIKF